MKTLRILLFTLFIAVVAVDGQPSACVVWNPVYRDDTMGHLYAASTVWDCWNSCNRGCFAFDWNDNAADGKRCLIFDGTPNITRSVFTRECFSNAFGCEVWPSQQNTRFHNGQLDTTVRYGVGLYDCLAACYLNQSCTGVDWNASAPLHQRCWLSGPWSGPNITSPNVTHYDYNGTCLAQACVIWTPQRTTNVINGQPNAAWHVSECQKACINNSQCNGIYWNHTGFLTERAVLLCWLSGPWSGTNITITSGVEHYALNRNCLVQECPGGWDYYYCNCYYTTTDPIGRKTHTEARSHCSALQSDADLTSISDEAEWNFIKNISVFLDGNDYWLGLHGSADTWYDGNPSTYRNWVTPEPNEGTECVIYKSNGWADRMCNAIDLYYYTCKKESLHPELCIATTTTLVTTTTAPATTTTAAETTTTAAETTTTAAETTATTGDTTTLGDCHAGWHFYTGNCHCYYNSPAWSRATHQDARDRCQRMDADLTSISDQAEMDFVKSISMFLAGDYYWLGLTKVSATDVEWYDGTPLTYTEWRTGEPNEDGTACIYYSVTGWADRPCIALFYYTCKKHSLRPELCIPTTSAETTTSARATTTTVAETTTTVPSTHQSTRATPVYSVWPLYGPAAGGTRVTISGQSVSVSTVAAVYIGQYRTHPDNSSVVENTLYVTTLPVNATARHLAIELVLNNGLWIDTDHTFEYRPNPVFTDIRPREHLTVGGTKVTVYGSNLNSVAVPRITLTVVITRFDDYNITSSKTESSGPCKFPPRNAEGIELVCRMPNASVLDEFVLKQRQKREAGSSYNEGKRGVAVYYDEDGSVRADVYIGFELDGVKRYENISSVDHSVTFKFTTSPNISCQTGQLDFDPSKDKTILITGRHLTRGCSLEDYDIRLGDAVCVPVSLTDNQIDCRPPTNEPKRNSNDTFCDDRLSLQMNIGNYEHHCSCVRYVPQDIAALYIGLSVLLGLLIIVVALIIVTFVVLRRVQTNKQAGQGNVSKDKVQRSTEPNRDNMHHSRRTSDESMGDYNRQLPDECMGESQL